MPYSMEAAAAAAASRRAAANGNAPPQQEEEKEMCGPFQMPVHYPRYSRADYEAMPEWQLDRLLDQYGLSVTGDLAEKRKYAIGAFIWPSHDQ